MRIRTLLIWGTLASGTLVVAVIGYLVLAARNLDVALEYDGAARTIVTSLFEQSEILGEFLLNPGDRARTQWQKRQDTIGRLLDELSMSGSDDAALLPPMHAIHRKQAESFARLLYALELQSGELVFQGVRNELQQHRATQVKLASQALLTHASRLGLHAQEIVLHTLYELAVGIAVLVAGMVTLLAGIWFMVGLRVVRPIARLQQEIRGFTGGKVGEWRGIRDDDEIGDVARAFARMADNLSAVMVSRDELSNEVEIRMLAEQKARELASSLEARTVALDAVNKELESFAYSVSHDLRAPLRSMAGFCQALVEDYGQRLDETGKDYVQRISAASKRMGRLIDDLLTLSRVTRTEIEQAEIDLSDIAESIANQLRETEPGRDVEFRIQPGVVARGDGVLLRTVLENLLGNAWKYSSKKPRAMIEFGVAANDAEHAFFVRDDGVGFDMGYADKLFQPFQRLHHGGEFEGTGIGLASVANIIRRHGGRVWADSMLGLGTTMHFTLSQ